jgi:hypothetical protein
MVCEALVFLAMIVGCSSSAPSSPPDFCAQFSQALCDRAVSCGTEPNVATCDNVTNANGGYPENCGTFACNAGLTFNPKNAQACVAAEQAASCADINGNVTPSACSTVCQ